MTNQATNIPYGYCHCGCGQKTTIAKFTDRGRGNIKGEPIRYVIGHNNRFRPEPRPVPVKNDDGTITIYLTQGQTTIVDAIDEEISPLSWHAAARTRYAGGGSFVAETWSKEQRAPVLLHRLVMERALGRSLLKSEEVDHQNCNTLDNRRSNLRLATTTQNHANQRLKITNKSGYKGVSWDKSRHKWRASIQVKGKGICLGRFTTAEEAHEAYKTAAVKYFGEFARFE